MASECGLKFVSKFVICPPDSDLNALIQEMNECNSDSAHKILIDTILTKYTEEPEGLRGTHIRNVLMEFFIRTGNKKNLKKYMYEKLNLPVIQNTILFKHIVNSLTNEINENINNLNIFNIGQCHRILCFLSSFIDHLGSKEKYVYLLESAFSIYLCILEVCTSQLFNSNFCLDGFQGKSILEYIDCYKLMHMTLRQLSFSLRNANFVESLNSYSVKMVIMAHEILQCHRHLKFDTIMDCAIVFSYFSLCLPQEEKVFLKHPDHPVFDFIDNPDQNNCLVLNTKRLSNLFETNRMKIILNLSAYYSVNPEKLYQVEISGKPVLEYLYINLIRLGIKKTIYPDQVTPIAITLNALAQYLGNLQNFDEIFERALDFSWAHLNHFAEQVVTNTKSFLGIVAKEGMRRYSLGEKQHLEKFLKTLNTTTVFGKVRLNALLCTCSVIDTNLILLSCPQVQNQLLTISGMTPERNLAGQVYITLMSSHFRSSISDDEILRIWLRPVILTIKNPTVKYHAVLQKIIIQAFQTRPTVFRKLFPPNHSPVSEAECITILKCLHYARMHGIELPIDDELIQIEFWRTLIMKSKMDLYMLHQSEEVRLTALQVVAECQKTTEEFTEWELIYLIKYFKYNMTPQSMATRNKMFSYYKKVIVRFRTTHSIYLKKLIQTRKYKADLEDLPNNAGKHLEFNIEIDEYIRVLDYYDCFLLHFLQFLILYLCPDANFYRKSICLDLLVFLQCCIEENSWLRMFPKDDTENLKHILHDNYECNKAMAVTLLRTLPGEIVGFENEASAYQFFRTCLEMACDIRPSRSVTASYMFQVLFISKYNFGIQEKPKVSFMNRNQCLVLAGMMKKLENMFSKNKGNIIEAAKSAPFYGLLLSCRNLLQNRNVREDNNIFSLFFRKLADLCLQIQEHIMPMVCNPSPEGHIPDDEDTDDSLIVSDQSSKAQQIMVYSWKTMKEIMLLLAELINQTVTLESAYIMLPQEYLFKIGDFFMDVFIKSKHRGVFEQAHAAFTTVCKNFARSKQNVLNNLPVRWLNEGIAYCQGTKIHPELSSTRRSAGLPFLILSIVPVLVENKPDYARQTIEPLITYANINNEFRIHCLNVLRFIFKNSKLGDHTKPFIDSGTIVALEGYRSTIWGVRNSSTLLLTTMIIRIFGVPSKTVTDPDPPESRLSVSVFYMRYNKLFHFLLKTLKQECEKSHSLILHPVLVILSKLSPSHDANVNEQIKEHIPYINICLKNPSYPTRDLAARASVSLIGEHLHREQLDKNFSIIANEKLSDTECHGLLLQICHILYYTTVNETEISKYLKKSTHLLSSVGKNYSHLTVTLYMNIVFGILTKSRTYDNLDVLRNLVCLLSNQFAICNQVTTCRTSFTYSHFQLLLYILLNSFQHVAQTYDIVNSMILTHLYSDDLEMKTKCLHLLIYLNQEYSSEPDREHPLIISGDVEICPQIKTLVHSLDLKTKKELLSYTHPYLISYFHSELQDISNKKNKAKEDSVLVFLLLRFYPCFFDSCRNKTRQEVLNWFLEFTSFNEELTSSVISCLRCFITTLGLEELRRLEYTNLIKLLMESASPNAADFRRLTVAMFLVCTQALFKHKIFTDYDRYNIVNIIMVLLEDDEPIVRNTISDFPTKENKIIVLLWHVVPHKARFTLLAATNADFGNHMGVCCLASWALRSLPEVSKDVSEVYERGELNTFAENIPVTEAASSILNAILWRLHKSLSYEDRSIFIEEQTLLVTTLILNSLIKIPSPMMDKQTKYVIIRVVEYISKFLEECTIGAEFQESFKKFFHSTILRLLRESLDNDYSSAKMFLVYLYNPVLNERFRFPN